MKHRTWFASGLCLFLVTALHAERRAFTIEDLYRLKSVSEVEVAPDRRSVAYVVTSSDLPKGKRVSQIWMADLDGRNARQLTTGEKSSGGPAFSPDGKWLSFVSSRDGSANLYLLPLAGGEAKRLTRISTGVADPIWSPDGKSIAFSSDVYPECGEKDACNKAIAEKVEKGPLKAHMADSLLYRHWTAWKDGTRTHTFVVDIGSSEVRDVTPGDFDAPGFQLGGPKPYAFSPDSRELVVASNHDRDAASSTNSDLWLINLRDAKPVARNITAANRGYDGSPQYSPDGRFIAYRTQSKPGYESDILRIALYERSSGTSRILTSSTTNWIDEFAWSADSRNLYFTGPGAGTNPIFRVDATSGAVTQLFEAKTIDEFDLSPAGDEIVYVGRSVGEPVEVYRASLVAGRATPPVRVTHLNDAIVSEVDIRPAETMWVDGALGRKVHVFIVKPHNFDPNRKYPLILNVHGGPQGQWADAFRGDWQVYPGAGYVVAFANPHGSTGYGQEFTAQISGEWGGAVYEDLMKVTDALEKLPYVDRSRLGAMGWSYGGYMMNWFAGHTDRFKALASMMGIFDLKSFYGATEELWFPEWDLKGDPWTSDLYDKWSPSNHVKNFKTPTLVIAGERDYRVPYTESLQMFTALQKMNVPSRLIVYSDAGHWPSWYEMALYYTAHLEWFQKYLGGGGPPWTSQQFLRNAVFDADSGKRIEEERKGTANEPSSGQEEKQQVKAIPKNQRGKPAQKPATP